MSDQPTFEGMPTKLFSCTPSRLDTWLDCPRKYRFTYIDTPRPPRGGPWAHASMGAAVHNALREWWTKPLEERTTQVGEVLLIKFWRTDGFKDDEQAQRSFVRAKSWITNYLKTVDAPYVLKADGLAGGKGVVIHEDLNDAIVEIKEMLGDEKFGEASSQVVIEEFLEGIEFSIFVLTDGNGYLLLPEAKDYKRINEGDKGLNTGGMGAVSPVPFMTKSIFEDVKQNIIESTIKGLSEDKIEYVGFIFFGLILTKKGVQVIEYNCRMGDPETEAVFPRIEEDILLVLKESATKKIISRTLKVKKQTALTVMKVSGGYPEKYPKGLIINGIEENKNNDCIVFQAGTKMEGNKLITNGGRVLCVTGLEINPSNARKKAYDLLRTIKFEGEYYRHDIGNDLGIN